MFLIIDRLHVRGRCVISQSYENDKRKILLDIRSSLMKGQEEYKLESVASEMSERELAEELYRSLSGFRCLIVVEDMRDIQALDVLRAILQKSSRGSKILLITRFAEVAFQVSFTYVVKMDSELLANRFQLLMPQYLNVTKNASYDSSETNDPTQDEAVVGFKYESLKMLERLVYGPEHLQVVSIVGMGGIGKSTLAKRVYNDNIVGGCFDLKAWCLVSQKYEGRNLLLQILHSVNEVSIDYRERSVEELAEMLYKCLKGWKYLIVLDDMWNIEAWNVIKGSFPDDSNGSRILLTIRLHSVAQGLNSCTHFMRPLSDGECWELLHSKIFRRESCPPELLTIGVNIMRNCKGIPLLIVLTAGFLARTKKKEERWKQVAEILNSPILDSIGSLSMSVTELCYKYLPDHLKLCLLYFGGFPEDK